MREPFLIALRTAGVTLVLTGVLYPLGMTALGGLLFPGKAHGSLVSDERGNVVGSSLIGQRFVAPAYFQPRPSAAGSGYDATASAGSNLGPASLGLRERAKQELARLHKENPEATAPVPAVLLTASGSGLDPHLSMEGAGWQIPRIASARGITAERIRAVLDEHLEGRELWILGEPRVNVLLLNLALDRRFGRPGVEGARAAYR